MSNIIEVRHDSTGKEIKLHDVLRDDETGEMALVVHASSSSGLSGLAVVNEINGINDWLDVYPEGMWTIVGNAATEDTR